MTAVNTINVISMTVGNPIDKFKKGGQFMKLYIKSSNNEPINQICDIDDDGRYTTFFLYTDESGYWYWTVDTASVKAYQGTMEEFVDDEENYNLGSSTAYFDTLEEAKDDYYSDYD